MPGPEASFLVLVLVSVVELEGLEAAAVLMISWALHLPAPFVARAFSLAGTGNEDGRLFGALEDNAFSFCDLALALAFALAFGATAFFPMVLPAGMERRNY